MKNIAKNHLAKYPITKFTRRFNDYEIIKCPHEFLEALSVNVNKSQIIRFECFLQITGNAIPNDWDKFDKWNSILYDFFCALLSKKFTSLTYERAIFCIKDFIKAINKTNKNLNAIIDEIDIFEASKSKYKFEKIELNDHAVAYWSGWPVHNALGKVYWLPLSPVFRTLGKEWTEEFHLVVANYFAGIRAARIPGLKEFALFIENVKPNLTDLANPFYINKFWRDFWNFYVTERGKTANNEVLQRDWANHWRHFAENKLTKSGLFAKSYFYFPGPTKNNRVLIKNKNSINENNIGLLLIDIPREASDKVAFDKIIKEIPKSLEIISTWSSKECNKLYNNYLKRKILAKNGIPRELSSAGINHGGRWLTSRDNNNYLANAAATFKKHGYKTEKNSPLALLYPTPLSLTAQELGLPTAGTLLPFATQLVLEHPQITASFLENFELYNKNGKLTGLRKIDGGTYLVGVKNRSGEQIIKLNFKTVRIIWKIISITSAVREYLKNEGNDDWRYLFITTGKGWGQPIRLKRFATDSSGAHRLPIIKNQLIENCGISSKVSSFISKRFSLRSLRETVAISVFIETHSEEAMSEALGHSRFDSNLLSHYLPESLLAFFRFRWISAFQTNILIIASKGTKHALKATGFKSYSAMENFLENNALPKLNSILTSGNQTENPQESANTFYFNANEDTLMCIAELAESEERNLSQGISPSYWGQFSLHMKNHLNSRVGIDPDLDACLHKVRIIRNNGVT